MDFVVINQEFAYDPSKANILYVGNNQEKALNAYRSEINECETNFLQIWENEKLEKEFKRLLEPIYTPFTEEELRLQRESFFQSYTGATTCTGCMPEYHVSYEVVDNSLEYFPKTEYL